jgi:quinohemoprotein ethanol dehydrogenase
MTGYRGLMPLAALLFAALLGAQSDGHATKSVGNAELGNEADGTDWPAYGRTFSESRFSPLGQVNDSNVSRLGLASFI